MKVEKLELKHLAAYLPYGLKIMAGGIITKIFSINTDYNTLKYVDSEGEPYNTAIWRIKPILRPLSEIVNVINEFEQMEYYGSNYKNGEMIDGFSFGGILKLSINDYQKLLSLHFDIYNLIESGLAIDINTQQTAHD